MHKLMRHAKSLNALLITCFILFVCFYKTSSSDESKNLDRELCEILREKAAISQMCYQFDKSIEIYQELISAIL